MHLLFENDLVDELRLFVYPVVLGRGKRLFSDRSSPRSLTLTSSATSKKGVLAATYERAGEVQPGPGGGAPGVRTGTFETQPPSAAELERRRSMIGA